MFMKQHLIMGICVMCSDCLMFRKQDLIMGICVMSSDSLMLRKQQPDSCGHKLFAGNRKHNPG